MTALIQRTLDGQRPAASLLQDPQPDCANLDAVYRIVKKILPGLRNSEDPQTVAAMRSLLPFLQKELERGAAHANSNFASIQAAPTLRNVQMEYEPLCDLVQANLDGQRAAAALWQNIEADCADPDAIYLAIKQMLPNCSDARICASLRGFCRALQKQTERGMAG